MMNCYIIMSPRTGFKATIWWSLTTQMKIFLQSQTQCEQKRWKLQPFYLDLTLKQFYTCSQQIILILFEPIFKSVLNILCIMLNSHLNRYKTIEKISDIHDMTKCTARKRESNTIQQRPNTAKPAIVKLSNATIWPVLWSQPISLNKRLVRCFNYVTPLWSAVDNYQHLSVRRKAWNTPSLVTDWNQRFDQKQQSVTFMTWQSEWQYAAKKRKERESWELTEERARRRCKWWWIDN
jgi:hypothetical protein